jgi:hypothetical protein
MHSVLANLAQEPSRPPCVLAVAVARGSARTVRQHENGTASFRGTSRCGAGDAKAARAALTEDLMKGGDRIIATLIQGKQQAH